MVHLKHADVARDAVGHFELGQGVGLAQVVLALALEAHLPLVDMRVFRLNLFDGLVEETDRDGLAFFSLDSVPLCQDFRKNPRLSQTQASEARSVDDRQDHCGPLNEE